MAAGGTVLKEDEADDGGADDEGGLGRPGRRPSIIDLMSLVACDSNEYPGVLAVTYTNESGQQDAA